MEIPINFVGDFEIDGAFGDGVLRVDVVIGVVALEIAVTHRFPGAADDGFETIGVRRG